MTEYPQEPQDCPICHRVENKLRTCGILKGHLSETDMENLIREVQGSILNKEVIKTRGINMTDDEKYLIAKSSFEDFYETQDTLVKIMDRVVDRIKVQDRVIMKFGAAISQLIAKDYDNFAQEEEEDLGQEAPMGAEGGLHEEMEEEGPEDLEEDEEEVEEEVELPGGEGMIDTKMEAKRPPMDQMAFAHSQDHDKKLFEAGFKAAFAEMQKQRGVPVTQTEFTQKRPVGTADATSAEVMQIAKSANTDYQEDLVELGMMNTTQMNAMIREQEKRMKGGN